MHGQLSRRHACSARDFRDLVQQRKIGGRVVQFKILIVNDEPHVGAHADRQIIFRGFDMHPIIARRTSFQETRQIVDAGTLRRQGVFLAFRIGDLDFERGIVNRMFVGVTGAERHADRLPDAKSPEFKLDPHRFVPLRVLVRQPQHDLLPEPLVFFVVPVQIPQPGRVGGESHRAAASHFLRDQQWNFSRLPQLDRPIFETGEAIRSRQRRQRFPSRQIFIGRIQPHDEMRQALRRRQHLQILLIMQCAIDLVAVLQFRAQHDDGQ